jgi:restriction system protein
MLPVLKLASDGAEHRISDVVDSLAEQLKLSDSEREELLPSGKQPVFSNRVHWAKTYLTQAKLLIGTRRFCSQSVSQSLLPAFRSPSRLSAFNSDYVCRSSNVPTAAET